VVAPSQRDARSSPSAPGISRGRERAVWLVLAVDGPATELATHVPPASVRIVADPRRFRDLLLAERPRVVVCAQPPATARDLIVVASERRRRSGMRAVHIAPPDAVAERLGALGIGFDDALTTATPAAELAGRLGLLEARARDNPGGNPVLVVAPDLELDLTGHELRRAGVVVHLRPKEFGLLALLAAHPGRAYTRRQLLDRVWGEDHDGGSRTVDVHVRWLRSKIEPDPAHPVHLLTVRGVGYRLAGPTR
jgi:two-component system, OmpR family, response regulator RegX3